jgi:hypothetical protein
MSKAYDRVEWCFLKKVIRRIRFDNIWIRLVMTCVPTINYNVIVNGNPMRQIIPSKGINLGNPLSPYLSILCAEALNSLI